MYIGQDYLDYSVCYILGDITIAVVICCHKGMGNKLMIASRIRVYRFI